MFTYLPGKRGWLIIGLLATFSAQAATELPAQVDWFTLKKRGWTNPDGMSDDELIRKIYKGRAIFNYPWTEQFFVRDGTGPVFLANKKAKTLSLVNLKTRSQSSGDLGVAYLGNKSSNCAYEITDKKTYFNANFANGKPEKPTLLLSIPEKCIDQKKMEEIKAQKREQEQRLGKWMADGFNKEHYRRYALRLLTVRHVHSHRGTRMKHTPSLLLAGALLLPLSVQAVPNLWSTGSGQGVTEYRIANTEGSVFTVNCTGGQHVATQRGGIARERSECRFTLCHRY